MASKRKEKEDKKIGFWFPGQSTVVSVTPTFFYSKRWGERRLASRPTAMEAIRTVWEHDAMGYYGE